MHLYASGDAYKKGLGKARKPLYIKEKTEFLSLVCIVCINIRGFLPFSRILYKGMMHTMHTRAEAAPERWNQAETGRKDVCIPGCIRMHTGRPECIHSPMPVHGERRRERRPEHPRTGDWTHSPSRRKTCGARTAPRSNRDVRPTETLHANPWRSLRDQNLSHRQDGRNPPASAEGRTSSDPPIRFAGLPGGSRCRGAACAGPCMHSGSRVCICMHLGMHTKKARKKPGNPYI